MIAFVWWFTTAARHKRKIPPGCRQGLVSFADLQRTIVSSVWHIVAMLRRQSSASMMRFVKRLNLHFSILDLGLGEFSMCVAD